MTPPRLPGCLPSGRARGSFLRGWRLLAVDGFEVDLPDIPANAAEFGYAGSGENRPGFPKARVVAVAECGTHAFVAAEVAGYGTGEKTMAQRLYPRLRPDELLTADRGFYSWAGWDTAPPRPVRRCCGGPRHSWSCRCCGCCLMAPTCRW